MVKFMSSVRRKCLLMILNRRKLTILLVMVVLVKCLLLIVLLSSLSSHESGQLLINSATSEDYARINDDVSNVDTSNYQAEYLQVQRKWAHLKKTNDYLNRHLKIVDTQTQRRLPVDRYLIFEYTKIMKNTRFCEMFDQRSANLSQVEMKKKIFIQSCPYTNCEFTCNQARINEANVLMFHESDLKRDIRENKHYLRDLNEKVKDRSSQIWLLWNDEANVVGKNLDPFKFNWTMSYRIDSEVSDCSYGCTYTKTSRNEQHSKFVKSLRVEFEKRANSAVWFVSNCDSRYRMKFASSLKTHFPLKVFGSCGKWVCSAKENCLNNFIFNLFGDSCARYSDCELNEFTRNKFYLSFESKNCSNYLTEKLWRILRTNLIPVVLQPSRQFYQLNAPPNSFIHAEDFDYDPVKLATYLKRVASNFELYFKHLEWKFYTDVVYSQTQCETRRFCELCTKLNTEKNVIYYEKVSEWFNNNCLVN